MTTLEYSANDSAAVAPRVVPRSKGRIIVSWLTTTDHKTLGYLSLIHI